MKTNHKKLLSSLLASLTISTLASECLPNITAAATNSVTQTLKNNKSKIVKGIVTATAITVGGILLYNYLSPENITSKLSADKWFEALGGTQQDIDNYNNIPVTNDPTEVTQINLDVKRPGNIKTFLPTYDNLKPMITRILQKFTHENGGFTQGLVDICCSVIYKFYIDAGKNIGAIISNDPNNTTATEAKIYYVFKKITTEAFSSFYCTEDKNQIIQKVDEISDNKLQDFIKAAVCDKSITAGHVLYCCYACPNRWFRPADLFNLWEDLIILPHQSRNFNREKFETEYIKAVNEHIMRNYSPDGSPNYAYNYYQNLKKQMQ